MARYKITALSLIGDRLVQADEEITVDAAVIPGSHWEPLDDEAKAVVAQHQAQLAAAAEAPAAANAMAANIAQATAPQSISDAQMAQLASMMADAMVRAMTTTAQVQQAGNADVSDPLQAPPKNKKEVAAA